VNNFISELSRLSNLLPLLSSIGSFASLIVFWHHKKKEKEQTTDKDNEINIDTKLKGFAE